TFIASRADDFLQSGDKNFRPINLRWGPNGEIYCIDWHDQNPCHQAAAGSWDYEHGRVYRIQTKGLKTKKAEDLSKKTNEELAEIMKDPNPYQMRTAFRLLFERDGKFSAGVRLNRGDTQWAYPALAPKLWDEETKGQAWTTNVLAKLANRPFTTFLT